MVITLNSDPFDVTIENEKTLNELLSGLTEWLDKSGYIITDIIKDGIKLTLDKENWDNIHLDTIEKLDIKATSEVDKYISDLQTLYQYITMLYDSVKNKNKTLTEDLLSEFPFIKSSMDFFFTGNHNTADKPAELQKLLTNFKHEDINQELILLLQNITLILKNRIKEISSPFTSLLETAEKLKELIPEISNVAVMLQTGDDRKAINTVLQFIELSEDLIRIFPFLKEFGYTDITQKSINEESFNDFYIDFNGILRELVEAFDINDSILIGDLMEYEIAPRVNKLLEYINLIKKLKE